MKWCYLRSNKYQDSTFLILGVTSVEISNNIKTLLFISQISESGQILSRKPGTQLLMELDCIEWGLHLEAPNKIHREPRDLAPEKGSKLDISPYLFNHHYDSNDPQILAPIFFSMVCEICGYLILLSLMGAILKCHLFYNLSILYGSGTNKDY